MQSPSAVGFLSVDGNLFIFISSHQTHLVLSDPGVGHAGSSLGTWNNGARDGIIESTLVEKRIN
jgi:hypothetical protein